MISSVHTLFFSPTGSTAKIAQHVAHVFSPTTNEYDLTQQISRCVYFQENDIVVVAMPVFSGRVPHVAIEKLMCFKGTNTRVITMIVYGNRAYDDAMLELNNTVKELGFILVASAAFVAQHSIIDDISTGRPNAEDFLFATKFAEAALNKINTNCYQDFSVPGNTPYKIFPNSNITPITSSSCTKCETCIRKCPAAAIDENCNTIVEKCILCMRCIKLCKNRFLPEQFIKKIKEMLLEVASVNKKNEMFM